MRPILNSSFNPVDILWISCGYPVDKLTSQSYPQSYPQVIHRISTGLSTVFFSKFHNIFLYVGNLSTENPPHLLLLLLNKYIITLKTEEAGA
jgi:hypothetical protein